MPVTLHKQLFCFNNKCNIYQINKPVITVAGPLTQSKGVFRGWYGGLDICSMQHNQQTTFRPELVVSTVYKLNTIGDSNIENIQYNTILK